MGSSPSIEVHHDADSPTTPGQKSVLSDALDAYCDYDGLFSGIIYILRAPLLPLEELILKEVEVVEHGPEDFSVKVVHDGKKRQAIGMGTEDGGDAIRSWTRVRCDHAQRTIITEEFRPNGTLWSTSTMRFLKDPLRVESYRIMAKDGSRKSGAVDAAIIKRGLLRPIIRELAERKVRALAGVDSPSGNGISAMSEPLDDYTTYEQVLTWLLDAVREHFGRNNTVDWLSEDEFEIRFSGKPPPKEPGTGVAVAGSAATATEAALVVEAAAPGQVEKVTFTRWQVKCNRPEGMIYVVASIGTQLLRTSWLAVRSDPLRVEFWVEQNGERLGGRPEAERLQILVDLIVEKAEGGNQAEWFW